MKCEEAGEWFGIYRDLPEDSAERLAVDMHVRECAECSEEFKIWEESALLIQELPFDDVQEDEPVTTAWMNQNVMNRIYTEQSWYMPTVRRTYSFTFAFRRKVARNPRCVISLVRLRISLHRVRWYRRCEQQRHGSYGLCQRILSQSPKRRQPLPRSTCCQP